ncbi:MAG: hypothetical protein LBK08_10320 [Treponema sp.]|jgi:hypothetical protein|nr:hypothetical protein [Treponema sp.]
MKTVTVISLVIPALFFGVYAMLLEFRGMNNFDQVGLATLFGILAFFAGR